MPSGAQAPILHNLNVWPQFHLFVRHITVLGRKEEGGGGKRS